MAVELEKNRRRLHELLQLAGNGECADCGAAGPEWASFTLGVFVCQSCTGIHRNIPQISRVKSVLLDPWETSEVEFMASTGNNAAKAKYEQKVPAFYYCPTHLDCLLLREQWIRARYERNEFIYVERQEPYSAGSRWFQSLHGISGRKAGIHPGGGASPSQVFLDCGRKPEHPEETHTDTGRTHQTPHRQSSGVGIEPTTSRPLELCDCDTYLLCHQADC